MDEFSVDKATSEPAGTRGLITTTSKLATEPSIGGKSLSDWDADWVDVPGGFAVPHPQFRGQAGLYRGLKNAVTAVMGISSEKVGNRLYKRLADFRRVSISAREHPMGEYIYVNRHSLRLQVLVTGTDLHGCASAEQLLPYMLERHQPTKRVPKHLHKVPIKETFPPDLVKELKTLRDDAGTDKNDTAIVLISASLANGICSRLMIVHLLVDLGFKTSHVREVLRSNTAETAGAGHWRFNADKTYTAFV